MGDVVEAVQAIRSMFEDEIRLIPVKHWEAVEPLEAIGREVRFLE